jgi:hypothetical protein
MRKKSLISIPISLIALAGLTSFEMGRFKKEEAKPISYEMPKSLLRDSWKDETIKQIERENSKESFQKFDDFLNYRTDDFNKDSEERLLARLIFGEAEGCSKIEKIAVAYTVLNREKIRNMELKEVILQPFQYSCFNTDFDSSTFLKKPLEHNKKEFLDCLTIAQKVLGGKYKDPTGGADYYYQPKMVKEPYYWKYLIKIGQIPVGNGKKSIHVFGKSKPLPKKLK